MKMREREANIFYFSFFLYLLKALFSCLFLLSSLLCRKSTRNPIQKLLYDFVQSVYVVGRRTVIGGELRGVVCCDIMSL